MKKLFITFFMVCGLAFMASAQNAGGNTYLDKAEGLARAHLLSNGCFGIAQPNIAVQYSYDGISVYTVRFGVYDCPEGERCRLSTVAYVKIDSTDDSVVESLCND